jgi:hypothetical protein
VLLADDSVTLAFPPAMAFHRARCEEDGRRRVLEEVLASVYGRALRPRFEHATPPAPGAAGEGSGAPAPEEAPRESFDRLRTEEVEALKEAPAVKALEKVLRVRMVRAGRRRGAEPAREGAGPDGSADDGTGHDGTEERE